MKKIISLLLCVSLLGLCACGGEDKEKDGVTVISTVFAPYDFTKQIAGELADSELLIPPGTEAHTYEPTPQDILNLEKCELFIYVGGESEEWVESMLDTLENRPRTIRLMDIVELYHEETLEGMEEHDHDDHEHEEAEEYDEHVWTSPANAVKISRDICTALCEVDENNSAGYRANADKYTGELEKLDTDFRAYFKEHSEPLVFGDRFPLLYFAKEYGLTCYAAFPGCSSQTEPSAATVSKLIEKVRDEGIKKVYYIEFSNHLVADAIAEETGVKTALFHTCHNVSGDDIKDGTTYLGLMRKNFETLGS